MPAQGAKGGFYRIHALIIAILQSLSKFDKLAKLVKDPAARNLIKAPEISGLPDRIRIARSDRRPTAAVWAFAPPCSSALVEGLPWQIERQAPS